MRRTLLVLALIFGALPLMAQTLQPVRLSDSINTEDGEEIAPVISADGKTLYFCASGREDNIGGEDIFVSHFVDGHWTKAKVMEELSTEDNSDAIEAVSVDGNTIIFFRSGQIYKTHKTADGWSEPELYEELNYQGWNADISISADGNAIFFASGYNGWFDTQIDIYVIVKQPDGSWSEPIKLDSTINAGTINRSPFIHPDMKTLYFSTNGYSENGDLDIYKVTRLDENDWTKWSEPVPLTGINTDGSDWGLKVTTDGTKAYFNRDGDIYVVELPKQAQAERVVTLAGLVTDQDGKPLDADIIWEDLETGKKLGQLRTDPSNGKYFITLPPGKNYGVYVSKDGYYPVSTNIDLRGDIADYNIEKNFTLNSIESLKQGRATIQLNNVFFETNSYRLKPESYPELRRLAQFLKENPDIAVEISGHTDNTGSAQYNLQLSQKRANAVRDFLISQGCNPSQLKAVGYGETKPVADNSTEEGRARNRRVEFKIITL